ncbi:MAG: fumarylacetoacetate hydrolase family protein [Deltaproteobacteria bacterium]|uniref:Fumarylacetoacetate hydrolase family protein n=1 Tax=Candidatus Zymogenus saltonus TaxID=2844893 RepID=A0A9D8PRE5_9DELT|nr:fumarylacetoacetate hydrolase family protein [Candidatus Zymogenus saltonus]
MKIVRFFADESVKYGMVEEDMIVDMGDEESFEDDFEMIRYPLSEVILLAPSTPSKVVAVGLNYLDHAEEVGMKMPESPMLFIKPSTSIIGPGEEIVLPGSSARVDYEGELGIVIGREAKKVTVEKAKDYIFGYTCLNDVTARDLQIADIQFTRAKSFDTFCPIGPWVETELDPTNLAIETTVNEKVVQSSNTKMMNWNAFELVSFISNVMTLLPGDIIATGTPPGIGPITSGDVVEITIERIGTLKNRAASDKKLD